MSPSLPWITNSPPPASRSSFARLFFGRLLGLVSRLGVFMELDPVEARKKMVYLHAQAAEHAVSVDDIMRRNLLRELIGGGAKP
jgi:hypothetical protein